MKDYVIHRRITGVGKVEIVILKRMGSEDGVPCYEDYQTVADFPAAAELIRKLEAR